MSTPEPRKSLTLEALRALLADTDRSLKASRRTITDADEALENWVGATSYGEQVEKAFETQGEELTWKQVNTPQRVRVLISEDWSPCGLSLGTSHAQCDASDAMLFFCGELLAYATESKQERDLARRVGELTPAALEGSLARLASENAALDTATSPVVSALKRVNDTARSLTPAFAEWAEAKEPKPRQAAAVKIREALESIDAQITAVLPALERLHPLADAHAQASLAVHEALRPLATALGRWLESRGEGAPPRLRSAWERVRPSGD